MVSTATKQHYKIISLDFVTDKIQTNNIAWNALRDMASYPVQNKSHGSITDH